LPDFSARLQKLEHVSDLVFALLKSNGIWRILKEESLVDSSHVTIVDQVIKASHYIFIIQQIS